MIPFNFAYLKAETIDEAIGAYQSCLDDGLAPFYYGGGTEIVTFARDNKLKPGAVIDIKGIPECVELHGERDRLIFGAGLPLNKLRADDTFPLLGRVAAGIADHTVRNRLTLGGNIAGQLPYRETVLPLLVCGAEALVAGPHGKRTLPINELFEKRVRLEKGELLVQVKVPRTSAEAPWHHVRRERGTRTDYPIVSVSLARVDGQLRMAASGVCSFPFRSNAVDETLSETSRSAEKRAHLVLEQLPSEVRSDQRASAEYRSHLFVKAIIESITELEQK